MPEKVLERNRKSRRSMKLGARRDEWTKLDTSLRLFIYRHLIAKCRAPSIAEMAKRFKSRKHVDAALLRLCASHAFVLQENGELWRAAPFSAVPTAFPVRIGNRPRGGVLGLQQGCRLAKEWYGDRLSPAWRPKSASEAEAAFARIGLKGEFWKLLVNIATAAIYAAFLTSWLPSGCH